MQNHPVSMGQRQFRIGDLADELKVKKFVIRFWEQEFGLSAERSEGGHRFYTSTDLQTFQMIKDLLHNQGYTIEGARKRLPVLLSEKKQNQEAAPEAVATSAQEQEAPVELTASPAASPAEAAVLVAATQINDEPMVRTCNHESHQPVSAAPCTTCHKHSRHLAMVKDELEALVKRLR